MKVQPIESKTIWDDFLSGCKDKTFMQSWEWANLQRENGSYVWRFGVYEYDKLTAIALVIKVESKRGTYLLVPHGPLIQDEEKEGNKRKEMVLRNFMNALEVIGRQEGAVFIRVAPLWQTGEYMFKNIGMRRAPMYADGAYEASWKLDISPSEDEVFKSMRKTTRYLIRQTLKNDDIAVTSSNGVDDAAKFYDLSREVAMRQGFIPFSFDQTKREFEVFTKEGNALWFWGTYKGDLAAGALVIFWSGVAFYHQAASRGKYAKYSIPYRIQWEAIKEAKKRGCKMYDFWGYVDPKKYPNHPWAGPTMFKMGFGGKSYEYVGTHDLPLGIKYWVIALFETIRRIRRGL